jgi:integrase
MKSKSTSHPAPQAPRLTSYARTIALPAVQQAVLATCPSGRNMKASLTSHLLGYLADPLSGWDQISSPQITSLLSLNKIARHIRYLFESKVADGLVRARGTSLRRIQRAICPAPSRSLGTLKLHSYGRTNIGAMQALDQVGNSGLSFAELVASWPDLIVSLQIRRINLDHALEGFNRNLIKSVVKPLPVSAPEIAIGNLSPEVVGKWKVIAEAITPNSEAVIGMTRTSTSLKSPSINSYPAGRKSNAAVIREAKAAKELRLRRASIFDMSQLSWPQWEELEETIQSWALTYRPELTTNELWSLIRPAYLRLISLARPGTTSRATNISSNLVGYLKWRVTHRPVEMRANVLDLTQIGSREDIDLWISSMIDISSHSKASRRSDVRGVLNALYPEFAPVRLPRQVSAGPYSYGEIAQMRALAKFQPTTLKSMHLSALIALCAGAGLTPDEAAHVSPSDLVALDLGERKKTYLIRVEGKKARAVPLLLEFMELLEEAIEKHCALKYKATRNFLPAASTSTAHRVVFATQGEGVSEVDIQAYRLRASWLVTMMQAPVPLSQLLQAAGLLSTRILFDLVSYCQPIDPSRIQEILATASSKQVAA